MARESREMEDRREVLSGAELCGIGEGPGSREGPRSSQGRAPPVGLQLGHYSPAKHGPFWQPVAKPELLPDPGVLDPSPT